MLRTSFVVRDPAGLHAQSAARLCSVASEYACEVALAWKGMSCDAKSVFEVLAMGVPAGETVTVACTGDDERSCLEALTPLLDTL